MREVVGVGAPMMSDEIKRLKVENRQLRKKLRELKKAYESIEVRGEIDYDAADSSSHDSEWIAKQRGEK